MFQGHCDGETQIAHTVSGRPNSESPLKLATLEHNYACENQLIDAVSKGKLHLVTAVAASVFNNGAQPRLADSLRDRKNKQTITNVQYDLTADLSQKAIAANCMSIPVICPICSTKNAAVL
ncbi:MAG: hypothetical protein IJZ39_10030 [Oscillospiraceae bacterium]|nr:hypothetical protein [Oscillospiraceae bacterium]